MARRRGLVPLPPIPQPERPPWLDPFLAGHPEERAGIEAAEQRAAEERAVGYAVVRALYEHFGTGAPSRRGLKELLIGFVALLDEHDAESRRRGGGGR